jgi:hypothetical protein
MDMPEEKKLICALCHRLLRGEEESDPILRPVERLADGVPVHEFCLSLHRRWSQPQAQGWNL